MRLGLIAISATALLCTVGGAVAQNTSAGTPGGTLCSDLLALDTTSQGAFLQGYQAATQDALVTAGTGNAMGVSSASGPSMLSGTGSAATLDTASIISNCKGSPTSPLAQIISGAPGTASSSP